MRPNGTVLVGLAVVTLLTGCGGGGGSTATGAARDAGDQAAATSTARSAPGRGQAPAGHRTSRSGADGGASDRESTGTASRPAHRSARPRHASGGAALDGDMRTTTAGSVPLVDPGDYTYRAHGHADTALGDRDFDGTSRLTVTAPADDRRRATLRGEDGTSEQTLVGRSSGLYLADLKMSQEGFSSEFHPDQPVLLMPAGAKVGDHWSWRMRSTDGDYTLHATLGLADDEGTATVSGRQVHTVTVKGTLVLDGKDFSMTLHQTDEAAAGGLIVHEHTVGDGTAYGTPVHTEADRRLLSD